MHMSMQSSSPPPSTSRYADDPGYLAPVEGRLSREQHRNAVRAQGLRERRSEAEEPSHHQMCSLLIESLALMLAEGGEHGPEMARAFQSALVSANDAAGWRMTRALTDRIRRRLTPDEELRRDHLATMRGQRDRATVEAARRAARVERSRRVQVDRLRRNGLLEQALDDGFTWGDDEQS